MVTFPAIDTAAGTDFSNTWKDCTSLIALPLLDLSHMTNGIGCFSGDTLNTSFYSALLSDLSARNTHTGVTFDGGHCTYATGTPTTARNTTLIAVMTWTITDGGPTPWQTTPAPPVGISNMLLLTDGSVMGQSNGGSDWYRLRPDAAGDYAHGTWTALAPMHDTRTYFASTVLRDGRVFVAGGEYGTGGHSVEIYDPTLDTWTVVTTWDGSDIGDSTAATLDDGRVLLFPRFSNTAVIWDPQTNVWTATALRFYDSNNDEENVARLPDGSFIAPNVLFPQLAQRYIPQTDQWVDAGTIPVNLIDEKGEIGTSLRLTDGRFLFLGASGNTAFYTPGRAAPTCWRRSPGS